MVDKASRAPLPEGFFDSPSEVVTQEEGRTTENGRAPLPESLFKGTEVIAEPESSMLSDIEDILGKRWQEQKDIFQRTIVSPDVRSPSMNLTEYGLQTAGLSVLGTAGDIIGRVAEPAFDFLTEKAFPVTTGAVKEAAGSALNTETGQSFLKAIGASADKWKEFSEESPNAAADISALFNVASMGISQGRLTPEGQGALGKAASIFENWAKNERVMTAQKIIRPDREVAEAIARERIRDTQTKGPLSRLTIDLNEKEKRGAELLADTLNRKKTLTENYNLAWGKISEESEKLKAALAPYDNRAVAIGDVVSSVGRDLAALAKEKPGVSLNKPIQKKVQNLLLVHLNKYKDKTGKISPQNLLIARQEFDRAWQTDLGGQINLSKEGGLNVASLIVGATRRSVNNKIGSVVPEQKTIERLGDVSSMIAATESILPKAVAEHANSLGRKLDSIGISVPHTAPGIAATGGIAATAGYGSFALLTGLSGLPAAIALGGAATSTAAAYAGLRHITSPAAKDGVAKAIRALDASDNARWFAERQAIINEINNLYTASGGEGALYEEEEGNKQ